MMSLKVTDRYRHKNGIKLNLKEGKRKRELFKVTKIKKERNIVRC